ncbi:hypothetical protein BKA69DRAFT_1047230 [Paraphysoderma sedebokerense]|nr:hypothetical protein BKA69DRAFT_1047230 [Paraphysoderma sedebokerense]
MPLSSTVSDLKTRVESLTGIPPECQKLLYKGMLKDDAAPLSNYKLQGMSANRRPH